MEFTRLETTVLQKLIAQYNGDFGYTDDARGAVDSKNQLAGVISSLIKKDIILVSDGEFSGQFVFCGDTVDDQRALRDRIKKQISGGAA